MDTRRRFRLAAGLAVAVAAAALATWVLVRRLPATPSGQPSMGTLDPDTLGAFRGAFNAASDRTRILALLSPT